MAYFLDPELAALTRGGNRKAPATSDNAPAAAPAPNRRPNKFGKRCSGCNTWVQAGKGYLGRVGGNWVVYCHDCP